MLTKTIVLCTMKNNNKNNLYCDKSLFDKSKFQNIIHNNYQYNTISKN